MCGCVYSVTWHYVYLLKYMFHYILFPVTLCTVVIDAIVCSDCMLSAPLPLDYPVLSSINGRSTAFLTVINAPLCLLAKIALCTRCLEVNDLIRVIDWPRPFKTVWKLGGLKQCGSWVGEKLHTKKIKIRKKIHYR